MIAEPTCFGGHFYTFLVLLFALSITAFSAGAFGAERPSLVTLYTMDNCGPCERVKKALVKNGTNISIDYVTSQPLVDSFPTCVYSNGKQDNGLRVFFSAATLPPDLTIIHYKGY